MSLENQECIVKEIGIGITHRHISNPYDIVEEKETVIEGVEFPSHTRKQDSRAS